MALVALLAAVLRPAVRADAGGCRCRGAHQAGVKLGWYGGEVCALHPRAASFPAASVLIAACRRPQSATVQASGHRGQPRCRLKLRSRGCAVRPARIGCGHRPHVFDVPVRFCQHPQAPAQAVANSPRTPRMLASAWFTDQMRTATCVGGQAEGQALLVCTLLFERGADRC